MRPLLFSLPIVLAASVALAACKGKPGEDCTDTPGSRRLEIACRVTDPSNPLTARVFVNRVWHHLFGRGIVPTVDDFGVMGQPPTNPELLDYLADRFVKEGLSLKRLVRAIVLSATYQMSTLPADPRAKEVDPQNTLLHHMPVRRLEAEAIRDAILEVSGALDRRMGGPGFDLFEPNDNYVNVYTPKRSFGPAEWRRLVYQSRPRMQPDDTFGAFDCPYGGQIARLD